MSEAKIDFLSPVGRLVQGSPFEAQDKNMKRQPLTDKKGNARVDYFCRIAFLKSDPLVQQMIQQVSALAAQVYAGRQVPPQFAWKIIDGDTQVDGQGVPYREREGFAGCYVIKFGSGFAPKCYSPGGAQVLTDPRSIKRGDFIRVNASVVFNGDSEKPGFYWNYNMVEFVAYGKEIATGPSGQQVFGGSPVAALPPGASATPLTPTGAPPAAPGFGQPPAAGPGFGAPPAAAAPAGGGFPAPGGTTPAPGFGAPAGGAPGGFGAPPAAPGFGQAPAQAPASFMAPGAPAAPAAGPGFGAPPAGPAAPGPMRHPQYPGWVSHDNGATWVQG